MPRFEQQPKAYIQRLNNRSATREGAVTLITIESKIPSDGLNLLSVPGLYLYVAEAATTVWERYSSGEAKVKKGEDKFTAHSPDETQIERPLEI
jgi:hypothetical protein